MWHWLLQVMGVTDVSGRWYGFWSGFGSDLGEMTLLAALAGVYRKHNCHTRRCWRIGRHVVDGTPWCNHHHQDARAAVADAQVSAGAGGNPAAAGLPADQRVVPPAATRRQ